MAEWSPFKQPVDFAVIDGVKTPGICVFNSDGYRNHVENKQQSGSTGQFTVVKGRDIPKYTLTLTLTSDDDWIAWGPLKRELDAVPTTKTAKARAVIHPQVQSLGIQASTYLGRTPELDSGKGRWTVTLHFEQWAPSQPAQSRIDGANGPGRQGYVEDELDRQIREAREQGDALVNG
jgi:hypothetical protein